MAFYIRTYTQGETDPARMTTYAFKVGDRGPARGFSGSDGVALAKLVGTTEDWLALATSTLPGYTITKNATTPMPTKEVR